MNTSTIRDTKGSGGNTIGIRRGLPGWGIPGTRLEWIMAGAMGARWLYGAYRNRNRSKHDITLQFSSNQPVYYWMLRWVERLPRQDKLSVFSVREVRGRAEMTPAEGVNFTYHGVQCWLEKVPKEESGGPVFVMDARSFDKQVQLRLRTQDRSICEALLAEIAETANEKEPPQVFVWQSWGNWSPVRRCPEDRVAILPGNTYNVTETDLRTFRSSERWYQSVGLPYRRGYLLHGIPGSGKTSLVVTLASALKMNVCLVSLNAMTDDTLGEAVRNMPPNSLLLLEDIDCAFRMRDMLKDQGGKNSLTFSGLLNVLDGAGTPDGRVTFMTTNHRVQLDSALIRPGRVDYELEFGLATVQQIDEMAGRFSPTAKNYGAKWASEGISMAEVQKRLIIRYRPTIKC